jgi:hypothetical protein
MMDPGMRRMRLPVVWVPKNWADPGPHAVAAREGWTVRITRGDRGQLEITIRGPHGARAKADWALAHGSVMDPQTGDERVVPYRIRRWAALVAIIVRHDFAWDMGETPG